MTPFIFGLIVSYNLTNDRRPITPPTFANNRWGIAPNLNNRGYNFLSISSRILMKRSLRRAINRLVSPTRKCRKEATRRKEEKKRDTASLGLRNARGRLREIKVAGCDWSFILREGWGMYGRVGGNRGRRRNETVTCRGILGCCEARTFSLSASLLREREKALNLYRCDTRFAITLRSTRPPHSRHFISTFA